MELPLLGHLVEKGKDEPEYFLALEITDIRVKSAVWIVANGRAEVIVTGSTSYWQGKDLDELIAAADDSLASAIQKLAEMTEKEPSKVILGLPAGWVGEGNKIVQEKGVFLKELTAKLELTPIGFVVTSEALIQYLKDQEGVPPSVIFVELQEEEIEVTLVHLGKMLGRQRVARSVDLGSDLEEGLTRFLPQAVLPSRIVLFDGRSTLETARQQLLAHSWKAKGGKLPFLHFPKVEILSEEETVKAVAVAGGAEAAKAIGIAMVEEQPEKEGGRPEEEAVSREPQITEADETEPAETEEIEEEKVGGFEEVKTEEFGFVEGADVRQVHPRRAEAQPGPKEEAVVAGQPAEEGSEVGKLKEIIPISVVLPMRRLLSWRPHLPIPFPGTWAVAGLSFLAVVVIGFLGWWFLGSARVMLEVQAKTLERKASFQVSPKVSSLDVAKSLFPGQVLQGKVQGQKAMATSGQKSVGTKAKGKVTIYSNVAQPVTLRAGTILTSEAGLKFTLDGNVAVASPSGTAENPTPGQVETPVTAADVGSEYNLAAGSSFSVPGFSKIQVMAKNATGFSEGDKRQVQAVSKEDKTKLSELLTAELTPKAKEDLVGKLPSDYQLIGSSLTFKTEKETFDKDVGDEATSLTLSKSLTSQAMAIPKSAVETFLKDMVKDNFPGGYQANLSETAVDFGETKITLEGSAKVDIRIKLVATPIIDKGALAGQLAGKDLSAGDAILMKTPGFIRQETSLTPKLPGLFAVYPHRASRINISEMVRTPSL